MSRLSAERWGGGTSPPTDAGAPRKAQGEDLLGEVFAGSPLWEVGKPFALPQHAAAATC